MIFQPTQAQKQTTFNNIVRNILQDFVILPTAPGKAAQVTENCDGVLSYAREVITFGMIYAEFKDAIKEGDRIYVV